MGHTRESGRREVAEHAANDWLMRRAHACRQDADWTMRLRVELDSDCARHRLVRCVGVRDALASSNGSQPRRLARILVQTSSESGTSIATDGDGWFVASWLAQARVTRDGPSAPRHEVHQRSAVPIRMAACYAGQAPVGQEGGKGTHRVSEHLTPRPGMPAGAPPSRSTLNGEHPAASGAAPHSPGQTVEEGLGLREARTAPDGLTRVGYVRGGDAVAAPQQRTRRRGSGSQSVVLSRMLWR